MIRAFLNFKLQGKNKACSKYVSFLIQKHFTNWMQHVNTICSLRELAFQPIFKLAASSANKHFQFISCKSSFFLKEYFQQTHVIRL